MRISDWSSDVCSSDLRRSPPRRRRSRRRTRRSPGRKRPAARWGNRAEEGKPGRQARKNGSSPMNFGLSDEQQMIVDTVRSFVEKELYPHEAMVEPERAVRSEERRVGKGGGGRCRSEWA